MQYQITVSSSPDQSITFGPFKGPEAREETIRAMFSKAREYKDSRITVQKSKDGITWTDISIPADATCVSKDSESKD